MPRTARVDYPGAIQHVTARGIERRVIFRDDDDRLRFAKRLESALRRGGARCFAWALMPNHVHLLVESGADGLPRLMARLGTGYALGFNRRHERAGHLFQNRYHSRLVTEESHLLAAIRYIHLNPVVPGLVPDLGTLDRWPWTGHRALMTRDADPIVDVGFVLSLFSDDRARARGLLRDWMAAGIGADAVTAATFAPPPEEGPPRPGNPGEGNAGTLPESLASRLRLAGWDFDAVVRHVCTALGIPESEVRAGRRFRRVTRARMAIAWLARRRLGMASVDVAAGLGVSGSALSKGLECGEAVVRSAGLDLDRMDVVSRGDLRPGLLRAEAITP